MDFRFISPCGAKLYEVPMSGKRMIKGEAYEENCEKVAVLRFTAGAAGLYDGVRGGEDAAGKDS